jgi:hypothetical protein
LLSIKIIFQTSQFFFTAFICEKHLLRMALMFLPVVIYTKTSKQPLQQQELFVRNEEESEKVLYSYGTVGRSRPYTKSAA